MLLIPIVFAVGGLLFAAIGIGVIRSNRRFRRRAVQTRATITDVHSRSTGNSGTSSLIWVPVVRFQTADGRHVEAEASGGKNFPTYEPGQPLDIYYDPAEPTDVRTLGTSTSVLLPGAFIAFGGLFFLMGAGIAAVMAAAS